MSGTDDGTARPALRVVSGDPSPDELAVLTAVLTVASSKAGATSGPNVRRGGWNDPARSMRPSLRPGPDGWRSAYLR